MWNNSQSFKKFNKIRFSLSVIFFLFSLSVFLFLYKIINDNKKISEEMQTTWQQETGRREGIKSLERSIKAIDKERVLVESHFAQSSDVVPFLDTIEKLAVKVNAKPEVVSVDILKDKTGLSVSIKASGSFQSIYKFLELLENSPYELEFTSVNFGKSSLLITLGEKVIVPVSDLENFSYELKYTSLDINKSGTSAIFDKRVTVPVWNAVFQVKLLSFVESF